MIDQRINDSLKELEQGLKNIDSARKQVERTINSYDGLHNSTSEYVTQLGKLTTKVKELVTAIGTDYNQKATAFDKDRKVIVDSANSAIHELSNSTETFKNSLNNVENKLKYSLIVNITLFVIFIIAKTKCAFFQNEMCIFCIFSRFPSSFLMGF